MTAISLIQSALEGKRKTCGRTDGRTDGRTEGRTDGRTDKCIGSQTDNKQIEGLRDRPNLLLKTPSFASRTQL
jgi:hypothetical protein